MDGTVFGVGSDGRRGRRLPECAALAEDTHSCATARTLGSRLGGRISRDLGRSEIGPLHPFPHSILVFSGEFLYGWRKKKGKQEGGKGLPFFFVFTRGETLFRNRNAQTRGQTIYVAGKESKSLRKTSGGFPLAFPQASLSTLVIRDALVGGLVASVCFSSLSR